MCTTVVNHETQPTATAASGLGWTTFDQAQRLAAALRIGRGDLLLDVGTGTGWPGSYIAELTGCRAVLSDPDQQNMAAVIQLVRDRHDPGSWTALSASAPTLPFRQGVFDAVVHSDVLCCLTEKLSMMKACRRVLRPAGRMAFSVIHLARGLSPSQVAEVAPTAPTAVASTFGYDRLSHEAGFAEIEAIDVSEEFGSSVRSALTLPEADQPRRAERERLVTRLEMIEKGYLRRSLVFAGNSSPSS